MKAVVFQGQSHAPNLPYAELIERWEPLKKISAIKEVRIIDASQYPDQTQRNLIGDADVAMGLWITDNFFDEDFFKEHPNLKYASTSSHGFGYIDKALTQRHGLTVTNTVYGDVTISQYAMALLFEICNHVSRHSDYIKFEYLNDVSPQKSFSRLFHPLIELYGKTMGIVGLGNIGYWTAKMASGFGMKIIAYDPFPHTGDKYQFIEQVPFDELLARSDVISLHCPYTDQNQDLINEQSIAKMKDGVILINTARGGLVDESALYNALMSRKIYAAGLDVLKEEPPARRIPLMDCPYCTITGHIAWLTKEARLRSVDLQIENFANYLAGRPTSVINE
ncbi:MAG: NAD(P)-dependent oxidoreductase [Oscillospiraceae bacterium]|nr:NAD(P)-dependent oxidoreductase [Oscillospiraceae bacterium]